jgi:protein-arginine kinase activator protein McsA
VIPSEAVESVRALLRCGHHMVFTNGDLPNVGDVVTCPECEGTARRVWLTPGVHKFHCTECKSASRSLLPSVIRGAAAQHAYRAGHMTLVYVEGNEKNAERIEGQHGHGHASPVIEATNNHH